MIVVDTSAIIAIAAKEPMAQACRDVLARNDDLVMSAGTLTELMIVSGARGFDADVESILALTPVTIIPVTASSARRAAAAYARWGRGSHRAALNFGDCFAYEAAMAKGCPLLFVGDDFAQTDVQSALSR